MLYVTYIPFFNTKVCKKTIIYYDFTMSAGAMPDK